MAPKQCHLRLTSGFHTAHACTHTHVHTCPHACTHTYTCMHAYMHACTPPPFFCLNLPNAGILDVHYCFIMPYLRQQSMPLPSVWNFCGFLSKSSCSFRAVWVLFVVYTASLVAELHISERALIKTSG